MRLRIEVVTCDNQPPAIPVAVDFAAPGGSIGRGDHNQLVLSDPQRMISRTHAELKISDRGEIELHDLGRATAVFVNGSAIGNGHSRRLEGSERLVIGSYALQLSVLDEAVAEVPVDLMEDIDPDASVLLPHAELLALAALPEDSAPVPLPVPMAPSAGGAREADADPLLADALAAMGRYFAARDREARDRQAGTAIAAALDTFAPDRLERQLGALMAAADAAAPTERDAHLWRLYCRHYAAIRQQARHTFEDVDGT